MVYIVVIINLVVVVGGVIVVIIFWFKDKKLDFLMIINGVLVGLVGIIAGCDGVFYLEVVIIGSIVGMIVVFLVFFFDKLIIDDLVGVILVYLICGIWGILVVGIFVEDISIII